MTDNILTNKYFVIALIIAFIVLLFLYSQKRTCAIEGMKNIEQANKNTTNPWTDDKVESKYKNIDDDDDKDKYAKKTHPERYLNRTDETHLALLEFGGDNYARINGRRSTINGIPQPLDMRPDLSQCQPCVCPGDSDSDSDYPVRKRGRRNRRY